LPTLSAYQIVSRMRLLELKEPGKGEGKLQDIGENSLNMD